MNVSVLAMPRLKPVRITSTGILLVGYSAIVAWLFRDYFSWNANAWLALITAPYICTINKQGRSLKYLAPAAIAIGLAILLPVRSMLFFAMLLSLLLLVENSFGKINNIVLFLILLVSPPFKYLTMLMELPVRLWLSRQVAALLSKVGFAATAAGNQISLDKSEFSVDPACAGLNMLVTSLIICLFVFSFYQRQTRKHVRFVVLLAAMSITVLLNVLSNFFRITILVLFKIMPGNPFHDLVGMVCLLAYVIVPLLYAGRYLFNRLPVDDSAAIAGANPKPVPLRYPLLHTLLLAGIVFIAFHLSAKQSSINTQNIDINMAGYHKTKLADGVLKFEDATSLIYLKPTAYYAPGHDPMICWTGSGYEFTDIRLSPINGIMVYTATLKKGADRIYAAWWFDNGTLQTADQLKWRWAAARGQWQFYLVNINATTPQLLKREATTLLTYNQYLKGN